MDSTLMRTGPAWGNRHTGTYYPWVEWFQTARTEVVTLYRGQDYTCKDYGMANQIRNQARKMGLGVSVTIEDGMVQFSVTGEKW